MLAVTEEPRSTFPHAVTKDFVILDEAIHSVGRVQRHPTLPNPQALEDGRKIRVKREKPHQLLFRTLANKKFRIAFQMTRTRRNATLAKAKKARIKT